jgi:hypothetical protein
MRATVRSFHLAVLAILIGCQQQDAASTAGGPSQDDASSERLLTRTAALDLSVANTSAASERVTAIAERHGGYVVRLDRRAGDNDIVDAELRVRADRLGSALTALRGLAEDVEDERMTTEDVTREHAELGARLAAHRQLEQRYLALVPQAQKLEDMLAIERELARARGEIESMAAAQRALDRNIALASITVTMSPARSLGGRIASSFRYGIEGAVALISGGVVAATALTPIAGTLAIMILTWTIVRRRRRARA